METGLKKMDISPRKKAIRDHFNRLADARGEWISRNRAYYDDDRKYTKFLVPEGARVLEIGCATGDLLARLKPADGIGIDLSEDMIEAARLGNPELTFQVGDAEGEACFSELEGSFDYIILSDTIGYLDDIERVLRNVRKLCSPHTRLIIAYYSHLWEPLLALAERIGQKMPQPEVNFLSSSDITNLLYLSGFEVVRTEWRQLVPKRIFGIGTLINRFIGTLPNVRRLCLRHYIVARPFERRSDSTPSVSILIPCRNEKGNIESAIKRMPRFAGDMEILYVEGHSSDGTFEESGLRMGCDRDLTGIAKAGMGVAVEDVDDDGDFDLIVCNVNGETDSFYLNDGGLFLDSTNRAGLGSPSRRYTRFGLGLVDFDNDARLDYFAANGAYYASLKAAYEAYCEAQENSDD